MPDSIVPARIQDLLMLLDALSDNDDHAQLRMIIASEIFLCYGGTLTPSEFEPLFSQMHPANDNPSPHDGSRSPSSVCTLS